MADDGGNGRLEIEIVLDDGSVRKGFATIKKEGVESGEAITAAFGPIAIALAAITAGFFALKGVKEFFSESIEEAAKAQTNLLRMNNALQMAGTYSEEASKQMQEYADKIQRTTTVEDDAVIGMLAFARNITKTNDGAIQLTDAAIKLGAAIGTGPETAMRQLNMTLDGHIGRLGKTIPDLAKLTEGQLKAGAAIEYVNTRFSSAATNELNTYAGALTQLGHVWGNVKEFIGGFVTESRSVMVTIRTISKVIDDATAAMKTQFGGVDIFKDLLINLSIILEASTETARRIGLSFELAFLRAQQAWLAFKVLATAGLSTAFNTQLQSVIQKIEEVKESFKNDSAMTAFFQSFIDKLQQTDGKLKEITKPGGGLHELKSTLYYLSGPLESVGQAMNNFEIGFRMSIQRLVHDARHVMQEQGAAAFKGLAAGVSSGMGAIGHALVKGQNIFKAFAGAMLSALGQAAMQMGATYMLLGLARVAASYGEDGTGWQLMGIGAGLGVLGGALMALGEGQSGTSPSTSASGGGGSYAPQSQSMVDPAGIRQREDSRVTVNIHGDVLDSRETGMRIIDMINEAGFQTGNKVFA